jgi:ABC-type polysaccharide/polyol phosphate export permease
VNKNESNRLLWQYAGLATQLLVSLGLAMFIGGWIDKKMGWHWSLLVWLLPLMVLMATLFKLIRDTSNKK